MHIFLVTGVYSFQKFLRLFSISKNVKQARAQSSVPSIVVNELNAGGSEFYGRLK